MRSDGWYGCMNWWMAGTPTRLQMAQSAGFSGVSHYWQLGVPRNHSRVTGVYQHKHMALAWRFLHASLVTTGHRPSLLGAPRSHTAQPSGAAYIDFLTSPSSTRRPRSLVRQLAVGKHTHVDFARIAPVAGPVSRHSHRLIYLCWGTFINKIYPWIIHLV